MNLDHHVQPHPIVIKCYCTKYNSLPHEGELTQLSINSVKLSRVFIFNSKQFTCGIGYWWLSLILTTTVVSPCCRFSSASRSCCSRFLTSSSRSLRFFSACCWRSSASFFFSSAARFNSSFFSRVWPTSKYTSQVRNVRRRVIRYVRRYIRRYIIRYIRRYIRRYVRRYVIRYVRYDGLLYNLREGRWEVKWITPAPWDVNGQLKCHDYGWFQTKVDLA